MSDEAKIPPKIVTPQEHSEAFAKHLIDQFFKVMAPEEHKYGAQFIRDTMHNFLIGLIGGMLYKELTSMPEFLDKEEQFEFSQKAFIKYKTSIQDSVALAFQGAMSQWAGKQIEYYCQVKPVPEVVNKYPC